MHRSAPFLSRFTDLGSGQSKEITHLRIFLHCGARSNVVDKRPGRGNWTLVLGAFGLTGTLVIGRFCSRMDGRLLVLGSNRSRGSHATVLADDSDPLSTGVCAPNDTTPGRHRSKRSHSRATRVVAQAAVVLAIVGTTSAFATLHKDVILDFDGSTQPVSAYGRTVSDVLASQHIETRPDDVVMPALTANVHDGQTIVVRTSHEVTVEIDGKRETFTTTARTVGELLTALGPRAEGAVTSASRSAALGREPVRVSTLKTVRVSVDGAVMPITTPEATVRGVLLQTGIVLGDRDDTSVPLDAAAVDGMLVLVNRAASTSATVTEALPFETEEIKDATLPEGFRTVVTAGRAGEAVTTYAIEMRGGAEVSRTAVTRKVLREPRGEVIKVGTMKISAVSVDPGSARAIAKSMAAARGWGDDQFVCLDKLWQKESGWRVNAENRSSGAYGIPQSLPGSKMSSAGADWRTNASTQITWGLGYIEGRYGTPCGAWAHSGARGWY